MYVKRSSVPVPAVILFVCLALPLVAEGVDDVEIVSGFDFPVYCTAPAGDYKRMFVLEKSGTILIVNLRTQTIETEPFLDISDMISDTMERGLLGLAFHPDYMTNGYFFIYYTSAAGESVIARYSVDPTNPQAADPDSGTILLTVPSSKNFHQAGQIAFSPIDGYLYIALGDNTASENAQSLETLRGKILRIDVDDFDSDTYAIPASNPYAGSGDDALDEIWAQGLRNPYRFSFDRETGDMYIGDVGGALAEEINFQAADSAGGLNYGWPCAEGYDCTLAPICSCAFCLCLECDCPSSDYVDPIIAYAHGFGRCAAIGGYVYRGSAIDLMTGSYVYGDWCSEELFSLVFDGSVIVEETELTSDVTAFCGAEGYGEDAYGELYSVSSSCGTLVKLVPEDIDERDCNENFITDDSEIAAGEETDCDGSGVPDSCEIAADPSLDADGDGDLDSCVTPVDVIGDFIRGDANADGIIGIGDPLHILGYLFSDRTAECRQAMDVSNDNELSISDPILLLRYLFLSGAAPAAPFPECGLEEGVPPADELDCDKFAACDPTH